MGKPALPGPVDHHVHQLAIAQMLATAEAAERLARAYVALGRAGAAGAEAPIAISPGQLRLVVGA